MHGVTIVVEPKADGSEWKKKKREENPNLF